MQLIENPTKSQLEPLQEVLKKEIGAGIVDIFDDVASFYLAAKDGVNIVGSVAVREMEECAELFKLYVAPSHRRKGVAEFLLNKTIEKLSASNFNELLIEVAGNSLPFWRKMAETRKVECYSENKFGIIIKG